MNYNAVQKIINLSENTHQNCTKNLQTAGCEYGYDSHRRLHVRLG